MKHYLKLIILLALLMAAPRLHGQGQIVYKANTGNGILESLKFGAGKTLTIDGGGITIATAGTFTWTNGATFTGASDFRTAIGAGTSNFNGVFSSLTGTPAALTSLGLLTDPGGDRIVFWDDSAGDYKHLTLGTNLSITGTTLDAAGGGAAAPLTLASGTITTSDPALTRTQTWNASGVTFIGSMTDITNTASAAGSLIEDWRVGGTSVASISKTGQGSFSGGNYNVPWISTLGGSVGIGAGNYAFMQFIVNSGEYAVLSPTHFTVGSAHAFGWSSGGTVGNDNFQTGLWQESNGLIGQYNGSTAQQFGIYNTRTSGTNFERITVGWQNAWGVARIGTEKGSGGGVDKDVAIITSTKNRHYIREGVVALTDASATRIFSVELVTDMDYVGGRVVVTIFATDGGDVQCYTNEFPFTATRTGGTVYATAVMDSNAVTAASVGSLTASASTSVTGNTVDIQVSADTSLGSTTTFEARYQILLNSEDKESAVITP